MFMNQMRAMKIGQEQRIRMKIDTSWKIAEWMGELAPTPINRCFVGHDGKTPYARLMGKQQQGYRRNRRVLAKISRGRQSQRKQALQTRWKEAVWVGIAKMSNEHIVVLEVGGRAVRCRTTEGCQVGWKNHLGNRRHAEEAQPQRARQEGDRDGRHDEVREARAVDQTRGPYRGRGGSQEFQHHQQDMATRLEDPDEKVWIEKRDMRRPTGKAASGTSAAPEVLRATGKDQKEEGTHDDELMNEVGG